MGFNKRIVNQEYILIKVRNNKTLKEIFDADSIICNDTYSSKCFNLYLEGYSDKEVFKRLENLI